MKRLFILIILMSSLSCLAETIGDEMYVFRNDGQINGFLPSEIICIDFSNYDADGNRYDEIVSQVVTTSDSVYVIPLAVIDSVSFVTPETVYQPGVINISDQLMPYVDKCEKLIITLSSSTPSGIIPHVGDKLVTQEMNEKFYAGFIGEVTAVNGNVLECKELDFDEVFETCYNISSVYASRDESGTRGFSTRGDSNKYGEINMGTFTVSTDAVKEIEKRIGSRDSLAWKKGLEFELNLTPTIHITSTVVVDKKYGKIIDVSMSGKADLEAKLTIFGGLDWEHSFLEHTRYVPLSIPGMVAYFEIGLKLEASAKIAIEATCNQSYVWGAQFKYDSNNPNTKKADIGGRLSSSSYDVKGCLEGEVFVGPYLEAGVTLGHKAIDKVGVNLKSGLKLEGEAMIYNSEVKEAEKSTKLYERLKGSSASLSYITEMSLEAEVGKWELEYKLPWNKSFPLLEWNIVPTFSDTKLSQDAGGVYHGFTIVKDLGLMTEAGLRLESINNETDVTNLYPEVINGTISEQFMADESEDYRLFPLVRFMGIEMIANPSDSLVVELCPDSNHPHMIDLGLPSGTKWSCCNVDALTPSSQGGLYAWGETSPKTEYHWGNYSYSLWDSDHNFTWKCMYLGGNIAGTAYDAATARMGARWQMPTANQLEELTRNTSYKWVNVNGVPGARYVGKNHRAIFLPGYGQGVWIDYESNFVSKDHPGTCGDYWSSTPSTSPYISYYLSANPVGSSVCNSLYRGHGLAIRPVAR